MDSQYYKNRKNQIVENIDHTVDQLKQGRNEVRRVHEIIKNTDQILDDLDRRFCTQTGLTTTDTAFLFLAIGLQIARQYLLSNKNLRINASQGDKLVDTALLVAPPSWRDVLTQSVPYDAIQTGAHISDTGLSGTTHRYRTLGHDPILGWIFGTANIMTNSLTKWDFETYQVNNMRIIRHYPMGTMGMINRAISYSVNDPKLLAASIARQAIHFGSDYFTKQGLPLPFIATVNNSFAQKMISEWHIDMWSVTRGITVSVFINQLVALAHGLFYRGTSEMDRKLYEVRTRKILSYSNAVATSSNVAIVAITHDMTKLDVGGMAVTIYRLITDANFIRQVKEQFIFGSYRELIMGNDF